MNQNVSAPVHLTERADILDALRGLALLGILLINIIGFSGWMLLSEKQREALSTWPVDQVLNFIQGTFVHGKFYSIFSLLFGIGFSVILMRNENRGINPLRIFYPRLFFLALFGILHIRWIWDGDILLLYALVGLALPLFRGCADRTLLIWAVAFILSPLLIDMLRVLFQFSPGQFLFKYGALIDKNNQVPTDETIAQYVFAKEKAWQHFLYWQEPGFLYRYAYLLNDNRIPKVMGMFLLGFYAGRKMIYLNLEKYVDLFKKLFKWGFIVGIPMSAATVYFETDGKSIPDEMGLLDTLFFALGVVPLSLAYVAWFCLHWMKTGGNTKWKLLAPMGRMALTNYLMQSILCIVVFYGIGFGLGGTMGPTIFFPIAFGIYLFQLLYSYWWMKHFNYGPFEWLWRVLTYRKGLRIVRASLQPQSLE